MNRKGQSRIDFDEVTDRVSEQPGCVGAEHPGAVVLMYRKNKNPFPAEKLVEQESLLGVASVEW